MWQYQIRQTTLDEIMIPTEEEIKRMSRLNYKLLDLTHQLYAKVSELWKVMNDSELHLYDDYCVEGAIKPKSVIRISLCRTAKRNPLIFPI